MLFHRSDGMSQQLGKGAIESHSGRLNQWLLHFSYVPLHSLDLSVQGNLECQVLDRLWRTSYQYFDFFFNLNWFEIFFFVLSQFDKV